MEVNWGNEDLGILECWKWYIARSIGNNCICQVAENLEFFDTSKKLAEQSSSFLKKYDEFHKYVDGINATIADVSESLILYVESIVFELQIGSLADTERMKLLALKSELARPDNFAGEDKQQLHVSFTNFYNDELKFADTHY